MRRLYYILYFLAIPHYLLYMCCDKETKELIQSDLDEMNSRMRLNGKGLFYYLIFERPYRNLFYHRIRCARHFSILLPRYPLFFIGTKVNIGGGAFVLNHPFSTIINAKKIGNNFTCCHLTTIGNAKNGRNDLIPTIGDNVSLGANVTIIGDITIGNNVTVGAGSVVVKDVPDNCVVAGNPAKVIRYLQRNDTTV